MDEPDPRSNVIVPAVAWIVVMLIGWQLRPRTLTRAATHRRGRPPRWRSIAGFATIAVPAVISPFLGLVGLVATALRCRWSRVRRLARDTRRVAVDFPDALDLLVLCIRAGYLPAQAVAEIRPYVPSSLGPAFGDVIEAMERGVRFADSLNQLASALGPIAQPLIDSLAAADRYGLPLAPVLERLSFEARQQRRRDTDASARELPVRLAIPLVICTLPSFVLLAIVPLLLGALSSLRT
jgi:tight adherence protein C